MKKVILTGLMMGLFAGGLHAQALPSKIKSFLDNYYSSEEFGKWKGVAGSCNDKKWLLTADFDGDGQTDYLVRFTTGKTNKTRRLHLIAFFNENGEFTPAPFYEEALDDRLGRSSTMIIEKGTTVSLGLGEEGEGPTTVLQTDGVMQYVCETDDSATFFFQNGEMKNIAEAHAGSGSEDSAKQPGIIGSYDKTKQMPLTIEQYLDQNFAVWEIPPASDLCGETLLFDTGDFDGDGKTDYAVYFLSDKGTPNSRLLLYAFLGRGENFEPFKLSEDKDRENIGFTSFSIIKKGTRLQTGEGESEFIILEADAVTEYTCETDRSATFEYKDGKFSEMDLYSP